MTEQKKGKSKVAAKRARAQADRPEDGSVPLANVRHELFCQLMVRGLTGRDAFAQAFGREVPHGTDKGTQDAFDGEVWRLRHRVEVERRMDWMLRQAAMQAVGTAERWLQEVAAVAFSSPACLFDSDGKMVDVQLLPPAVQAAIASVEVDEYGKVKVKFWDKLGALEKLGKHLGLYEKDNQQQADPLRELAQALTGQVVGAQGLDLDEAQSTDG